MACNCDEKHSVERAASDARLMADIVQKYENQNNRLFAVLLASVCSLLVLAGCMVWAIINAQTIANDALLNALNTVAEIGVTEETTTTTTITQDTGEGSGNNVYQAGENAVYEEGSDY